MNIVGDIEGRTAIIIDDIIDTAGTITLAAQALKDKGAKEVYAVHIQCFLGQRKNELKTLQSSNL